MQNKKYWSSAMTVQFSVLFWKKKKKYSVIVISSDSVENALIGFSNIKYKLVIRDLFMLRMGGTEGITQIKKENSKVLIIAISAGIQRYAGRCCYVRSTKD